jgi:hypothetical protein
MRGCKASRTAGLTLGSTYRLVLVNCNHQDTTASEWSCLFQSVTIGVFQCHHGPAQKVVVVL